MDLDTALNKQTELYTPEESKKINEEIYNLIQETKTTQKLDFTVHNAKSGYTFPITIISTLVLLLSASIFGVWLYSLSAEQNFLNIDTSLQGTQSNLASVIIDDVKGEAEETEKKLEEITLQLNTAINEQQTLETQFELRINVFREKLILENAENLEDFRKRLETEKLSSEEIESRLAQQNITLNQDLNQQLQIYRKTQEELKQSQEESYIQQIENLRQQQASQASSLNSLRSEIQIREGELLVQVEESSQDLLAAQRQLQQIMRDNVKRKRALDEFDLLFTNISLNISENEYESALEGIDRGQISIANSAFSSDTIATVYLKVFQVQEELLSKIISLQTQLSDELEQLEVETQIAQEELELETQIAQEDFEDESQSTQGELAQQLAILTNRLNLSQTSLLKVQNELESEKERFNTVNSELQNALIQIDSSEELRIRAEQLRDRTLERIDRISKTYAIQEKNQIIDQELLLSNIQNIIKHIESKSSGTVDPTLSNSILDLIEQEPVYRQIGMLLADKTNSTISFP